jgi:hypothetical protein
VLPLPEAMGSTLPPVMVAYDSKKLARALHSSGSFWFQENYPYTLNSGTSIRPYQSQLCRRRFLIKIAFPIAIKKIQGWTHKHIWIYLPSFSPWPAVCGIFLNVFLWQRRYCDFSLLLISSWMGFRFVRLVPKYLNSSTLSKDLLSIFMPGSRLWKKIVLK